jgi:ethanolamine utilization microcompartment shell protein EutS
MMTFLDRFDEAVTLRGDRRIFASSLSQLSFPLSQLFPLPAAD